MSIMAAQLDLLVLDFTTEGGTLEDRVLIAVSKALTVALVHASVESKITCRTAEEAIEALTILYSMKVREREHAKWNHVEGCLELPNGSAVSVWFNGKREVPKMPPAVPK